MKNDSYTFNPPGYLKNSYLQTILASNKIRALGKNPMVKAEKEVVLEAGNGIRLQGLLSPQTEEPSLGMVILLHGWEGSARSAYILSTGRYLYRKGYSIFRLHYRDHGGSHHLNEGVFFAIILDEVFNSVKQAAAMEDSKPAFIAGFSLGGNFALRIAKRCASEKIDNVKHIIAVSPGLNPAASTAAIDNNRLIRGYFLKKWKRSLAIKEKLFPDLYRFDDLMKAPSVRILTDLLLERYSNYGDTLEYLNGYRVTGDYLMDVPVPTTLIVSEDDPIIPVDDFHRLALNEITELIIHKYGGHNGFINSVPFSCWYEKKAFELFSLHN